MNLISLPRLAALCLVAGLVMAQQGQDERQRGKDERQPQREERPQAPTTAPAREDQVDAAARKIVRQMSEHLAKQKRFTFETDVLYDQVEVDGQKIQLGRHSQATVSRPGSLAAESKGDRGWDKRIAYDGRHFLIHDRKANVYSRIEVPDTMDRLFDHLFEEYGMTAPLADFLLSDVYSALMGEVERGAVLGESLVNGTPCHHLAFSQEDLDWQLWVEKGDQPWPRKVVITYKDVDVRPQFQATMSNWRTSGDLPKSTFDTEPPAGATQVPMEKRDASPARGDETKDEK